MFEEKWPGSEKMGGGWVAFASRQTAIHPVMVIVALSMTSKALKKSYICSVEGSFASISSLNTIGFAICLKCNSWWPWRSWKTRDIRQPTSATTGTLQTFSSSVSNQVQYVRLRSGSHWSFFDYSNVLFSDYPELPFTSCFRCEQRFFVTMRYSAFPRSFSLSFFLLLDYNRTCLRFLSF